jgi:outer membrane receptor for ferric coprogen and ferric-rhodotorulic acid
MRFQPLGLATPRIIAFAVGLHAFSAWSSGASAPAASSTATNSATETGPVTLTPFEVNTDRDVGYTASNSLAAGRLNTDLRDTAVAISVFTKDFLEDIGVLTVNEALEYGLKVWALALLSRELGRAQMTPAPPAEA